MNPILQCTGITRQFKQHRVLDAVDLTLYPNETAVLLGTNGAGKSTLLRCLLALDRPDAGTVRIDDLDPFRHEAKVRRITGYVPDQADIDPWMKVPDLFRFLAPHYPTWSQERAIRFIDALSLPLDRTFKQMSRGEAGKALIAAALAPSPRLLILDEAFARLSPPVREDVLEFFVREAPLDGGAALVATHDLDIAARLADRVWMLEEGRVTEHDPLEFQPGKSTHANLRALYAAPETEALAG